MPSCLETTASPLACAASHPEKHGLGPSLRLLSPPLRSVSVSLQLSTPNGEKRLCVSLPQWCSSSPGLSCVHQWGEMQTHSAFLNHFHNQTYLSDIGFVEEPAHSLCDWFISWFLTSYLCRVITFHLVYVWSFLQGQNFPFLSSAFYLFNPTIWCFYSSNNFNSS